MTIKFKLKDEENIEIYRDGNLVGQIFTPGGTGKDNVDCIQICGASDFFEAWGCGVFKGFKDIEMYFSDRKMNGKFDNSFTSCLRCYRDPCQCKDEMIVHRTKKEMVAHNVARKV